MEQEQREPPPRRNARRPTTGTRADSNSTIGRDKPRVYVAAPVLSYGTISKFTTFEK